MVDDGHRVGSSHGLASKRSCLVRHRSLLALKSNHRLKEGDFSLEDVLGVTGTDRLLPVDPAVGPFDAVYILLRRLKVGPQLSLFLLPVFLGDPELLGPLLLSIDETVGFELFKVDRLRHD